MIANIRIGKTRLSTWSVTASTRPTIKIESITPNVSSFNKVTKSVCDKMQARVPSRVFDDPGQ